MIRKIINKFGNNKHENLDFIKDNNIVSIVSFPKSGNTWIRFLISNLVSEDKIDFLKIREVIPGINSDSDIKKAKKFNPKFITSHYSFKPEFGKVIYIVRDPRSVAVSYYFYQIKNKQINKDYPFDLFLDKYLSNGAGNFGTWNENVGSWVGARSNNKNCLIIKYEDALSNIHDVVSKIIAFSNIKVSENQINNAIEKSQFDSMLKVELKQKENNEIQKWENTDKSINFMRKADPKEWKNFFTPSLEKKLFDNVGYIAERRGYNLEL